MGFGWQLLIFLGGIIPAALSVTGILMWWRSRQWRRARPRSASELQSARHGAAERPGVR
jgi:uncharacterized iron-regulated membrane protein